MYLYGRNSAPRFLVATRSTSPSLLLAAHPSGCLAYPASRLKPGSFAGLSARPSPPPTGSASHPELQGGHDEWLPTIAATSFSIGLPRASPSSRIPTAGGIG